MSKRILSALIVVYASCLYGGNWTPIPPDVWAMKEETSKGKGAVVLFERIHYGAKRVEYDYRVRIFSEAGRVAAQFADLPSAANLIEGRTVYPDGRVVLFNSAKDMKEVTVKTSSSESKHTLLEPPGISANCVVEIRWKMDPFDWWNFHGEFRRWLLNPVPTLESVVEFSNMLPAATSIEFGRLTPVEKRDVACSTVIFRDLPPAEEVPFFQRPLGREPKLLVFSQPGWVHDVLQQGPGAFWSAVSERLFKELLTKKLSKGWSWNLFSKELLSGLAVGDPHATASEIILKLDSRIAKRGEFTYLESERFRSRGLEDDVDPLALSSSIKRGWTSSIGMFYLAYQLMQDAGLNPKVIGVVNRYEKVMQTSVKNLYQFDRYVLGVDAPGKGTLILDPQDRTLPIGTIPYAYQRTTSLVVDTATWKTSVHEIPEMSAEQNLRRYEFQHNLNGGKHSVVVDSSFKGVPEYLERDRFFALSPEAQTESLKKSFGGQQYGWVVEKSEVHNATDRRNPIAQHVTAVREYEESRRMQISPFPGMPSTLYIPDNLPETRHVPISLGYTRTHRATARIKLPEGFHLVPTPAMDQKNYFGHVRWEVKADPVQPHEALLSYEVVLSEATTSDLYYPALLQFLGWVREAQSRNVIVEQQN